MENNDRGKIGSKIFTIALSTIVITLTIAGIFYIVGSTVRYIDKSRMNHMVDKALAQLTPAAKEQKEFPASYVKWMMPYCLASESDRNFTSDQQVNYCACFISEKVQRLTMKEQSAGVAAHWDAKRIPDTQKKLDEIDAECLQKILQ